MKFLMNAVETKEQIETLIPFSELWIANTISSKKNKKNYFKIFWLFYFFKNIFKNVTATAFKNYIGSAI